MPRTSRDGWDSPAQYEETAYSARNPPTDVTKKAGASEADGESGTTEVGRATIQKVSSPDEANPGLCKITPVILTKLQNIDCLRGYKAKHSPNSPHTSAHSTLASV